jgi:sortase (surface protein transpeptidase)
LRIPKIGLDTAVQQVGLDETGAVGVPSNYTDVAWYTASARPGNTGNAVIDGHLDSMTGPAVFYRLGDLQPGDDVFVTTADGVELRFVVTALETYATDDAPTYSVFGPATAPQLNLITCDGTFDHAVHQYDQRLLVRTVLAQR